MTIQKNVNFDDGGIKFFNMFSRNTSLSIYTKDAYNKYVYEGSLNGPDDELKVELGSYEVAYILVLPTSSMGVGAFQMQATVYGGELSPGALAGIILGPSLYVALILVLCIWLWRCIKKDRLKKKSIVTQPQQRPIPPYNQPQYNQPQYNQPQYNQAQYNQPPKYNQPVYNQPQPQTYTAYPIYPNQERQPLIPSAYPATQMGRNDDGYLPVEPKYPSTNKLG